MVTAVDTSVLLDVLLNDQQISGVMNSIRDGFIPDGIRN